jgi:hypothetical protein
MRAITLAVALCVLAGATGVAACGQEEESNADYLTEVNEVAQSFSKGVTELSAQVGNVNSLDEAGELLDTFGVRVDDLADELDDIDPPDAVAALNDRLVELLRSLGEKAKTAALAINAGDLLGGLPKLAKIAGEASDVGQQIDSTLDQIKAKVGK